MYRYTVHHVKGDGGTLAPPAPGYNFLSTVALGPSQFVVIWQQEGKVEAEWGGTAWRYTPRELEHVGEEPV